MVLIIGGSGRTGVDLRRGFSLVSSGILRVGCSRIGIGIERDLLTS